MIYIIKDRNQGEATENKPIINSLIFKKYNNFGRDMLAYDQKWHWINTSPDLHRGIPYRLRDIYSKNYLFAMIYQTKQDVCMKFPISPDVSDFF